METNVFPYQYFLDCEIDKSFCLFIYLDDDVSMMCQQYDLSLNFDFQ